MKTMTGTTIVCRGNSSKPRQNGFSLLELIVAMGIFMLISGCALTLFRDQQIASQGLAGQVGLNLSLRDAVAQIQMDLANAGSSYFQNANMPSWPIGVTIVNSVVAPGNSCKSGNYTYGPTCFDQLNVIEGADPNQVPPVSVSGLIGGCSTTDSGVAYGLSAVKPDGTVLTPANIVPLFSKGDQVLFMNGTGTRISTARLTHDPVVSQGMAKFVFNPTNGDGTNSRANDLLDITTCEKAQSCSLAKPPNPIPPKVTNQFCQSSGDWIMKIAPIIYTVDITADPTNPRLMRQVGLNGVPETVMEQVIGFKVGATIWNDGGSTGNNAQFSDNGVYVYDAGTYCSITCPPSTPDMAYNFSIVRSVRVSLIGRTVPDWRGTYTFRNGFDKGPYQVQGIAVVVNPRNMSMND
jgi:prepilin-type N-terminal cleavage/methylation domain-containing protein